jgi:hypothetical protein
MDDILFAKVNIPILDKETAAKEILNVDKQFWFWDNYRATSMLPLMTKDSIPGQHVFPWMGMRTRIMALKTVPKFSNLEHIDCARHEVGSKQHKFRIVVQGKTNTLYFKTTNGDVPVQDINEAFIMDGGWPHGMSNFTDDVKVTIAAGAPWNGLEEYKNIEVLLKRSSYSIPSDLEKFF